MQVSAIEQTGFLARLAQGALLFPEDNQQSVREILKLEQVKERVLFGKTGWAIVPDPDIGWWVGWVTVDGQIFSFALNIDMTDKSHVGKRVELGKTCLRELGIY